MLGLASNVWLFAAGLNLMFGCIFCYAADGGGTEIPVGGNGFITQKGDDDANTRINRDGLTKWTSKTTVISVYFKFATPQVFQVALKVKPYELSKVQVTIGAKQATATLKGNDPYSQYVSTFAVPQGYVKVDLQGISKTGKYYADVEALVLYNVTGNIFYIKDKSDFEYGRRGPSVHLHYFPKTTKPIEYFYNEVWVPKDQDIYGCYFMATGFTDGYFGIQRTEPDYKRVLFSIWADKTTNDPKKVTEENRVTLLDKGPGVDAEDFGNEGSGRKSSLKFDWKTETKYKFLVFGAPTPDGKGTNYTGWFKAPKPAKWRLIASFMKPKVAHNLDNLHSFSENFIQNQGYIQRKVYFGNQWVRTSDGAWTEVTKALFTGDATSRRGREDYAGGLTSDNKMFFLMNIGFFNEKVNTGQEFTRVKGDKLPKVTISELPD